MNGRARGATAIALRRAVDALQRGYVVRVATPETPAALRDVVAGAAEELVVAVGGDGTVNTVVSALRPGAMLAVLPIGTGNDFACDIGVPSDAHAAASLLVERRDRSPRSADLLYVNGIPFVTVGGVGLVTRTTAAVTAAKEGGRLARSLAQRLGSAIYKLVTAALIVGGRGLRESVEIELRTPDGALERWSGDVHVLFVVNHRFCGGGLAVPTGSRGDDGVFELGMVTAGSRAALALNFLRIAGRHRIPERAFAVRRATEAVIRTTRPVTFAADGELLDHGTEFRVTIAPGALRLR